MTKVMVIDDDLSIVELLETMLSIQGYASARATDSSRAVDRVREEAPDLILLDLMMPDVDGWQVLAALRRDRKLRDIPVVIITARADVEAEVRDPVRLGLAGLMVKPFGFDALSRAIRSGLSNLVARVV